ncbi:hypothetical protein [Myroides odoratus]|uniref:Uncharacterized protein n=1 Tax=Myroides odoratus TaxID=256 RepID=A0A9Q7EA27_MYROD|nr:hypothetical protein [Myroides odoratus]EHQ41999.1 hypothetical protein Myrod_1166 [Myroides odoratus DSM 2801]EKB03049.1 hypothetical protein HMPREF9716_03587 [Myroides odoratus CIP 103059]QQT99388.1 hypothetical protein I6I88_14510 [Myroides odoratus]WQD58410.1 hypothetical protein U0010_04450 [Myroides odoratus]STZ29262.1 Uncharacterised protein [Myroides odoratus]
MRNILIVLMLGLSLLSCHGKVKEKQEDNVTTSAFEVQETQDQQQPKPLLDSIAVDSIKAVLKQEYTKMREKENINWIYDRGLSKYRDVIYLDSISFKGKEAFYQKVSLDINKANNKRRKNEDERAKFDNEEPRYSYNYGGYYYFDAFQYIFPIVEVYLKTKKFVFPTTEVYQQRMNEVFGFSGQIKNSFPLMEDNGQLYCFSANAGLANIDEEDRVLIENNYNILFPHYFYNYSGYNFIYTSLKNWQGIPSTMFNEMEMKDTKNWTAKIRESIYHENNYLFNKSAISLNWLYLHDQEFLTMLYETFGYYGDDRLTQFYIEDVKDTFERFLNYGISPFSQDLQPSLFNNHQRMFGTYRPYDNKFLINKELLEKFVTLTNGSKDYMYPFILQYTVSSIMSSLDLSEEEIYRELNLFIACHLSYYSQKIYDKNPDIAALSPGLSHYSALYSQLYLEESRAVLLEYLKKNNYFGYPDYPAMIEEIRTEQGMW